MVNEIKGGSKGESADYLLYETGDKKDCIQYVPVVSKFKLSKQSKRNKTGKEIDDSDFNDLDFPPSQLSRSAQRCQKSQNQNFESDPDCLLSSCSTC